MICVDKNLIESELAIDKQCGFNFHYQKLSNRFIDWLFRHYNLREICENFYDSEPRFNKEEYDEYFMYLDYKYPEYRNSPHARDKLKAAYNKITQVYKDYESERIKICTWQEPYFGGNWKMSQKDVDKFGKYIFMDIRNFPRTIKDRLYVARKDNLIKIYFYGRDLWQRDYWFTFVKRKKRK